MEKNIQNHIAVASCEEVQTIMLPILQKHGMKVFNFWRIYFDGRVIRLSSDRAWTEHFFKKDYLNQLTVPESYLANPLNHYLWLIEDCPEMLMDAAINFDTCNGISIAKREHDYIETFAFATTQNNRAIINNFYLSNLDILHQYGQNFKEQAKQLIDRAEKEPLMINHNVATSSQQYLENEIAIAPAKLSKQQRACAYLLVKGMRTKEIARQLGLSPRTVEKYINHLKIKFQCNNQLELVAKLSRGMG